MAGPIPVVIALWALSNLGGDEKPKAKKKTGGNTTGQTVFSNVELLEQQSRIETRQFKESQTAGQLATGYQVQGGFGSNIVLRNELSKVNLTQSAQYWKRLELRTGLSRQDWLQLDVEVAKAADRGEWRTPEEEVRLELDADSLDVQLFLNAVSSAIVGMGLDKDADFIQEMGIFFQGGTAAQDALTAVLEAAGAIGSGILAGGPATAIVAGIISIAKSVLVGILKGQEASERRKKLILKTSKMWEGVFATTGPPPTRILWTYLAESRAVGSTVLSPLELTFLHMNLLTRFKGKWSNQIGAGDKATFSRIRKIVRFQPNALDGRTPRLWNQAWPRIDKKYCKPDFPWRTKLFMELFWELMAGAPDFKRIGFGQAQTLAGVAPERNAMGILAKELGAKNFVFRYPSELRDWSKTDLLQLRLNPSDVDTWIYSSRVRFSNPKPPPP